MPHPLVSVIILNYNGERFLPALLTSLSKTTYPNLETIIVDNASTDNSVVYLKSNHPHLKLILSEQNLGYTGGNNVGIRESSGQYVVLLNNDVEVAPDWLDRLVETAEADDHIGALQPKLQSMINKGYFEYAGASGGFIDKWGFPFLRGRIFDTIERDNGQYDDVREIFWASGAALFLRRKSLDESGLLDETFFMHFEEIDLCWRLHHLGYSVKVVPQSVVYHYVSASLPAANYRKLYWNHRNNLLLLIKNLSRNRLLTVVFWRMTLDGVAGFQGLLTGQPQRIVAVLHAHWWIYTNLKTIRRLRREVRSLRRNSREEYLHLIYSGSIVVDYFLKRKREFNTLGF